MQGYIEKANVNPVMEMTRLISVTRAFEAMTAAGDQSDRRLSDAIKAPWHRWTLAHEPSSS
jgi:flagellar basal-body rod protein FlgF